MGVIYDLVKNHEKAREEKLNEPTLIRLWDGDWNLMAVISNEYMHRFRFLKNDAGDATVQLPLDHWVAEELMDQQKWPTKSLYLTFDKAGTRWSGRVSSARVDIDYQGEEVFELNAIHDYNKLREILVWANPFLPAECQFPKAWFLFGPAAWVISVTMFVNFFRKGTSAWMLPDDPLDFSQWGDLDMKEWSMVVKPVAFGDDNSPTAMVTSRFKYMHDCVAPIANDASLSIECRRYLPGDPPPIPGKALKQGCLVFEVVDKGGYASSTAFGGDMVIGFDRAIKRISSDGLVENLDYIDRPEQPQDYYKSGFMGSKPSAPWVVLEDSPRSGVSSMGWEYFPPGPSQFVTGGSSMLGVNEGIKAAIVGIGGLLGTFAFGQNQLGSVADALLEPLYSDVFFAFKAEKENKRIAEQGWDYPYEYWVDGADRAYSIAGLIAMRRARYDTQEKFTATVKMENGSPYFVGPPGFGDFFIGDRVGVNVRGMPKNRLMVQQVESLEYTRSSDEDGWMIEIGKAETDSGIAYLTKKFENLTGGLRELGVW